MGCTSSTSRSSSPNNSAMMRRDDNNQNYSMDNNHMVAIDDDYPAKIPQQPLTTNRPNETILQAYQRIDEEICQLEKLCPGPRLATVEAWIDHLDTMDSATMKTDELMTTSILPEKKLMETQINLSNSIAQMNNSSNKLPDGLDDIDQLVIDNDSRLDKENDEVSKVRHLTIQLGVAFDKDKAVLHEEFLAKVSRNIMYILATQLKAEMIEHAKKRAAMLMDSYNRLRYLYTEQDNLITSTSGGVYLSKFEEKLDMELETVRQVRDKLGSVSEQWRTSGTLLRTSAKAALQAAEFWQLVGPSKKPTERVSLALDCRHALLSSLLAFEGAQNALPQVEIPFVTPRQASAVRHANIYMLTDMANDARYRHTKKVFETYQMNVAKAVQWLHDTYNRTLKKDLDDAEDAVLTIAKKLRQERLTNLNEFTVNRPYASNTADVR